MENAEGSGRWIGFQCKRRHNSADSGDFRALRWDLIKTKTLPAKLTWARKDEGGTCCIIPVLESPELSPSGSEFGTHAVVHVHSTDKFPLIISRDRGLFSDCFGTLSILGVEMQIWSQISWSLSYKGLPFFRFVVETHWSLFFFFFSFF